jgi:hypothetical protein
MSPKATERIIHGYDTTARRVLCGNSQQASSTKHFAFVTCTTCRELIAHSPVAAPADGALDPRGG